VEAQVAQTGSCGGDADRQAIVASSEETCEQPSVAHFDNVMSSCLKTPRRCATLHPTTLVIRVTWSEKLDGTTHTPSNRCKQASCITIFLPLKEVGMDMCCRSLAVSTGRNPMNRRYQAMELMEKILKPLIVSHTAYSKTLQINNAYSKIENLNFSLQLQHFKLDLENKTLFQF
jgi:hypothetical protein